MSITSNGPQPVTQGDIIVRSETSHFNRTEHKFAAATMTRVPQVGDIVDAVTGQLSDGTKDQVLVIHVQNDGQNAVGKDCLTVIADKLIYISTDYVKAADRPAAIAKLVADGHVRLAVNANV
ncbi:Uncharacterised protein [Serratia liquefaciens]|uniref:hypothetical protein n=1 Tax=Serratia liquefaciens TaxID=614 RepID=UPI00217AEDDA|nr:hypothetical protein [Serratia liquefaciens]CAI1997607.1 Uncharacterised protein [Serratia liquefaciens]